MYVGAIALSDGLFSDFHGSLILREVNCNGSESNLSSCEYVSHSLNSCGTLDNAAVICQGIILYEHQKHHNNSYYCCCFSFH